MIGEDGKQIGVMEKEKAIQMAKDRNLDLIQVTDKADPPVCKIMDYGKYAYQQKKKEKQTKQHSGGEIKGIRLGFNISKHDIETRAKQAAKFLKKGDKIRIEMRLRGREKALQGHARERVRDFLEILKEIAPIKIERELKKKPRGLTMIIAPDKNEN